MDWVFLVDRQRLLVDRLLLLGGGFEVTDGAFEFGPRCLELVLELGNPRRLARGDGPAALRFLPRLVDEADQQQLLGAARNRPHLDVEGHARTVGLAPAAGNDDAPVLSASKLDRRSKLGSQALWRHGQEIVAGVARRQTQIAIGRTERIKAFVLAVDQYRRRSVSFHYLLPA